MNIKLCLFAIVLCLGIDASAQISLVRSISCHGKTDGELQVQPRYGTAPYSFLWSNGSTDSIVKGLAAGTYTVTVTDNTSTVKTYSYVLGEPNLLSNAFTTTANSTWNPNNGSIAITTSGGNGRFSYFVKDSLSRDTATYTTTTLSSLPSGTFYIKTTDVEGCYRNDTVRVSESSSYQQISNKAIVPDTTACYKDVASTSINPDTASTIFPVYVKFDGKLYKTIYGYTKVASDTLNMYTSSTSTTRMLGLTTKSFIYITAYNTTSSGEDSATTVVNSVSNSFEPGFHVMEVYTSDNKGFRYSWVVDSVTAPVTINFTQKNDTCYGDKSGAIVATAQGSYADSNNPFKYTISGPTGFTTVATNTAKNLIAGIYTITATDWAGCKGTQTVNITQPDEPMSINFDITKEAKCPYSVDGSVTINKVEGATSPLRYLWSNGDTTQTINDVQAGIYSVTVTDGNGCKGTDSVSISFTQKSCFYNIVTPNGDGYNDYFDLTDLCSNGMQMEAKIFNEKGSLIASLDENNPKWDAKDPSRPPTGTSSTYTAFVILKKNGVTVAKFGESFSVIYSK